MALSSGGLALTFARSAALATSGASQSLSSSVTVLVLGSRFWVHDGLLFLAPLLEDLVDDRVALLPRLLAPVSGLQSVDSWFFSANHSAFERLRVLWR